MMKREMIHPFVYLLLGCALAIVLALFIASDTILFTRSDATWAAMQKRGTWRVGLDPSFPPFESLDADGKPVGYDLDLAAQIADELGLQLEIVAIGFDSLVDALQTGQIDSVISALPYDPRATQDISYSAPYFEAGIRLAVRAEMAERFTNDDATALLNLALSGRNGSGRNGEEMGKEIRARFATLLTDQRVAVEWGSMGDMVGRQLQRLEPSIELFPYETPNEAVAALKEELTIDALLVDNVTLRQLQGTSEGETDAGIMPIMGVGPALEGNPYVIAMPIRAPILEGEIGEILQMLQQTGKLSDLEKIWFSP